MPTKKSDKAFLRGERSVTFSVSENRLLVDETWSFEELPAAVQLDIAEAQKKFKIELKCASPFSRNVMLVEGLPDWRSVWGTVKSLHQFSFEPKNEINLEYSIELK